MVTGYDKAIAAFLGALVVVVAPFVPGIETWLSPGIISAVSVVIATVLVYLVPNKTA
jgi:hypothetical protein